MDRHWFPAMLMGLSVVLALVFAAVLRPGGQDVLSKNPDVREVSVPVNKISTDTYTTAITTLLADYAQADDAQETYDALISVRVPGNMLNVHYELVIAFGKLAAGDTEDGQARLTALQAQYPWLQM